MTSCRFYFPGSGAAWLDPPGSGTAPLDFPLLLVPIKFPAAKSPQSAAYITMHLCLFW